MADDRYTFAQARARLEDIVVQVRKKDTSLEKSLDLLEEGVRLANACTELSDHTEWRSVAAEQDLAETDAPESDEGDREDNPDPAASVPDDEAEGAEAEDDEAEDAEAEDDEAPEAEAQVDDEADSDR